MTRNYFHFKSNILSYSVEKEISDNTQYLYKVWRHAGVLPHVRLYLFTKCYFFCFLLSGHRALDLL